MGGKLEEKWDGPYEIVEKLSKGRYQLKSSKGTVLKKLYNGALLKEFLSPPQATSTSQTPSSPPQPHSPPQATSTPQSPSSILRSTPVPLKIRLPAQPQRPKKQRRNNCPKLSAENIAIVTEGKMLTDEHIHFASELLREQFPNTRGLQRTIFGQNLSFKKTDPPLCADTV